MERREVAVGAREEEAADLIPPEQRLMLELLQTVVESEELGDTLVLDGVDVLFGVVPGERRTDDEETHFKEGSA
jgi:hypothetical protein